MVDSDRLPHYPLDCVDHVRGCPPWRTGRRQTPESKTWPRASAAFWQVNNLHQGRHALPQPKPKQVVGGIKFEAGKCQRSIPHSCVYPDLFQYIPAAQESVIGVVIGKNGAEGFRVDIGGPHNANLDGLAFEGATKRNRPNLKVVSTSSIVLLILTFLGWVSVICARLSIPQRYGAGDRMFRCSNS